MNEYEIFDACRRGDVAVVESFCNFNRAIVNLEDAKGFTPLILAVYNEEAEAVDFFIAKGANVNAQDGAGNKALMGACFEGYQHKLVKNYWKPGLM